MWLVYICWSCKWEKLGVVLLTARLNWIPTCSTLVAENWHPNPFPIGRGHAEWWNVNVSIIRARTFVLAGLFGRWSAKLIRRQLVKQSECTKAGQHQNKRSFDPYPQILRPFEQSHMAKVLIRSRNSRICYAFLTLASRVYIHAYQLWKQFLDILYL